MHTYVISYDLHGSTEEHRRKVEKSIEDIGEHLKCLTTTYFLKTSLSREDILNQVSQCFTHTDEIIIVEVIEPVSGLLKTELREKVLNFL